MGRLVYGNSTSEIQFDDRTLAHIQMVTVAKLRRNESFQLTWKHGPGPDAPQTAIWINSSIPLVFEFEKSARIPLNRAWIDALISAANNSGTLTVLPEPEPKVAA